MMIDTLTYKRNFLHDKIGWNCFNIASNSLHTGSQQGQLGLERRDAVFTI